MRLKNKVAIITGGGNGIGRESALLFAQEGAKLLVVDMDAPAGEDVVRHTIEAGGEATFLQADVSVKLQCKNMIDYVKSTYGALHILFNNAGIMHGEDGDSQTTEEDVWDLTMNVNAKGVFFGCKYGIPLIKKSGGGSIINTASFVAFMGAATPQIAYTASKGAVVSMTRELAVRHARENIRVNAICPGPMKTELLLNILDDEVKRQRRLVHIPMGRFGEAREIASTALFLASEESSFITGTEIMVDGGITAAYVTPD